MLRRLIGVIVLAVAVWSSPALAESRFALIFSASQYEFLRPLRNPGRDADAMKVSLEALGFDVTIEPERDLKRMRRALRSFAEDSSGADVALVFFAGHGVEIAGENRLLPVDAEASSLAAMEATSLRVNEVREMLAGTVKSLLIVLDACRDDPFGAAGGEGRSAKPLAAEVKAAARPGLGRMGRAENTLFAFAAAPGQTASDGTDGNSPFSGALARYLGTEGLDIGSVFNLVQQDVYERSSGRQLPYIEDGLPRFFFAGETGALPERERLLIAMADLTPELRDEVERIAAERQMPLGPLYGALISADLKAATREDRERKLAEAADAFVQTRDELRRLASDDPDVTRLRGEAEAQLLLGAFNAARAKLAEAAAIDASSSETLAANLVRRRLSEADTHEADAGIAKAQLDYPAALAAYEKAATLHDLVENEVISDFDRSKRVLLLKSLGDFYQQAGNSGMAFSAYERMRAAAETHRLKAPGNAVAAAELALSLRLLADVYFVRGDVSKALIFYEDSLALRKIANKNKLPADGWQEENIKILNNIAEMKYKIGDGVGGYKAAEESRELQEKISKRGEFIGVWQPDDVIIANWFKVGDEKRTHGDLSGALAAYEEGVAAIRRSGETKKNDFSLQRDLSFGLLKISNTKSLLGDNAGSLRFVEDMLRIAREMSNKDKLNVRRKKYLSFMLFKVSRLRIKQGDLSGALINQEEGLEISRELAASDIENAQWQSELSTNFMSIGDLRTLIGDSLGARTAYFDGLAVAQRLVLLDPANVDWQRDLMLIHFRLSQNDRDSKEHFETALKIAEAMIKRGALDVSDPRIPRMLREELAKPD